LVIEEHARKREHVVTRIDAKDAVRTFLVRIRYGQTSSSATKKSSDYNNEKDRATIEATFEALMRLVGDLDIESTRAMREGLDEETLALFDLLKKPDLEKKDIGRIKKVAVDLFAILKRKKQDIDD
jgi:formylmethanofuran dehydrogenase subunit E-like metal-binding protein